MIDRETVLRDAQGLARNQQLVGDASGNIPRELTDEENEVYNAPPFRQTTVNEDLNAIASKNMRDIYPVSQMPGRGKALYDTNEELLSGDRNYPSGIHTDRNSLQGQAGPVGYTGRLDMTRTPQMPNIMMQRDSLQGQAGPVGYTSREQMLRNAQNMARYR